MNERPKSFRQLVCEHEATMLYIKHKIEWIENEFIPDRRRITNTATGHHSFCVENEVIKHAEKILRELKESLRKAKRRYKDGYLCYTKHEQKTIEKALKP